MSSPNLIALAWLALAVVLEILANLSLKWSDGLRRPIYGALSVAMVLGAFTCLAQAVRYIDLAVAYALWGGLGMVLTLLLGWVLFRQRLNRKGWAGLGLLLTGIALMKLA